MKDILFFVAGVVFSAVFWYWILHGFVPKIGFSEKLSKRGNDYEVKITNRGKRGAVDLTIFARLTMPGFTKRGERKRTVIVDMKLDTSNVPHLAEKRHKIFRISRGEYNELNDDEKEELSRECILQTVKRYEGSYITVYVFVYDEFSGTRKLVESRKYDKHKLSPSENDFGSTQPAPFMLPLPWGGAWKPCKERREISDTERRKAAASKAGSRAAAGIPAAAIRREDNMHERIQRRAYELWEREGRPEGREHANWLQAENEIAGARSQRVGISR